MKVGAIDHPDRFEDIFNPRYIQEVSEKKLRTEFRGSTPEKTFSLRYIITYWHFNKSIIILATPQKLNFGFIIFLVFQKQAKHQIQTTTQHNYHILKQNQLS